MVTYKELVQKAMPPEKRASASRCIISHYLFRPISNIISIPLIELGVPATSVTKLSAVFPFIGLLCFVFWPNNAGFWCGWFAIFVWNILDGVDGDIARYTDTCSAIGELWDAAVGWLAIMVFYIGMGFEAYYHPGIIGTKMLLPNSLYIFLGCMTAMCWIFPRAVMHKKAVLMGSGTVKSVQDRASYGVIKLIAFNIVSINGLGAILFALAYTFQIMPLCMIFYFLISIIVCAGSLANLLR